MDRYSLECPGARGAEDANSKVRSELEVGAGGVLLEEGGGEVKEVTEGPQGHLGKVFRPRKTVKAFGPSVAAGGKVETCERPVVREGCPAGTKGESSHSTRAKWGGQAEVRRQTQSARPSWHLLNQSRQKMVRAQTRERNWQEVRRGGTRGSTQRSPL